MQTVFPLWTDVNVMTFVGFGFLRVFLKTNSWSAVTFNMMIGCLACQWGILCYGFWETMLTKTDYEIITLDVQHLIIGSQGAAAAMITMGCLIGKVSYVQLYFLTIF